MCCFNPPLFWGGKSCSILGHWLFQVPDQPDCCGDGEEREYPQHRRPGRALKFHTQDLKLHWSGSTLEENNQTKRSECRRRKTDSCRKVLQRKLTEHRAIQHRVRS